MQIPVGTYLDYATRLQDDEKAHIEVFSRWLPDTIIDCHVHAGPSESVRDIDDEMYQNMVTTFPWFTIKQHRLVTNLFYPRKRVILLPFAMPYRGIDFRLANQWLLEWAIADSDVKPILYGIPDDINYTLAQLSSRKFFGLKMYMLYFRPPAVKICQYFPDDILAFINKTEGVVILHPPSVITSSYEDVITTAQRFPGAKFVIAHMGSATLSSDGLEQCYRKLDKIPNLMFDTALTCSTEAIKIGLNVFGHKRILYGTDQPLSLVRANVYMHPNLGERLATLHPYHWANQDEQKQSAHYAQHSVHLHWCSLKSLREAISAYGDTEKVREDIFYNNARVLFKL